MPGYVVQYKRDHSREMNGAKWEDLLRPYGNDITYNPEQIGTRRFIINCTPAVAEQIRTDHPELIVEEFVGHTTGPAPINFQDIKDQVK